MYFSRYEINYWFNFKEVMKHTLGQAMFLTEDTFKGMLSELGLYEEGEETTNPLGLTFISDFELSTQVMNRLLERYGHHYCLSSEEKEFTEDQRRDFLSKLVRVLDMTYPMYATILKNYKLKENTLLDKIKSKDVQTSSASQGENHQSLGGTDTTNKFNDTPQAQGTGDDPFGDDSHVSELTKGKTTTSENGSSSVNSQGLITTEHENDKDTPMMRLAEIQNNYQMIMLKWLDKFEDIFIEEGNI